MSKNIKHKFSFYVGSVIRCCDLKLILKIRCNFSQWSMIHDGATSECDKCTEFLSFLRKSFVPAILKLFLLMNVGWNFHRKLQNIKTEQL